MGERGGTRSSLQSHHEMGTCSIGGRCEVCRGHRRKRLRREAQGGGYACPCRAGSKVGCPALPPSAGGGRPPAGRRPPPHLGSLQKQPCSQQGRAGPPPIPPPLPRLHPPPWWTRAHLVPAFAPPSAPPPSAWVLPPHPPGVTSSHRCHRPPPSPGRCHWVAGGHTQGLCPDHLPTPVGYLNPVVETRTRVEGLALWLEPHRRLKRSTHPPPSSAEVPSGPPSLVSGGLCLASPHSTQGRAARLAGRQCGHCNVCPRPANPPGLGRGWQLELHPHGWLSQDPSD